MSAWKALELRVAKAFGTTRTWVGAAGSDLNDCYYSVEIKRSKRRVPEGRWIEQAKAQGKKEGKPWVLVVAGHNDRSPIVVCPLSEFLKLAAGSGRITGIGEDV
jgi:hypothetical protein